MEGCSFIYVLEVSVHAQSNQVLQLFSCKVLVSFDDFYQRGLVGDCAKVELALVLAQYSHELVLAV